MTDMTIDNELPLLADEIRRGYEMYLTGEAQEDAGRTKKIKGIIVMAKALGAARLKHSDNREFSTWLGQNELDDLNKNDRARLIEMSENLEAWEARLMVDEGTSIQRMYERHKDSIVPSPRKNDMVSTEIAETPETPSIPAVSDKPPVENSAKKNSIESARAVHRPLAKIIGAEAAKALSNHYICENGRILTNLHRTASQKGGEKIVRRFALDFVLRGECGAPNTATTKGDDYYVRMFVPAAPLGWTPSGFPTKNTPQNLQKIMNEFILKINEVTRALKEASPKPDKPRAFCDHQWELLRRARNIAAQAAVEIEAPKVEAPVEPALAAAASEQEKVEDNVVSIQDGRRIICLGTPLWPIVDASIYGLDHLTYEDARSAYDIVHELVKIIRAPALSDIDSIARKVRHMTSLIQPVINGANVADLMNRATYALKGEAEIHQLDDKAPPATRFAKNG